jgi:hypothetical protein
MSEPKINEEAVREIADGLARMRPLMLERVRVLGVQMRRMAVVMAQVQQQREARG